MRQTLIDTKLVSPSGRINPNSNKILKSLPDVHAQIMQYTHLWDNDISMQERLYVIFNSIQEPPTCPVCGTGLVFVKDAKKYPKFCSRKCSALAGRPHYTSTKLPEEVVEIHARISATKKSHTAQRKQLTNAKRKSTILTKYNTPNPWASGVFDEQRRQTNMQKYGVEHASQSSTVRQSIRDNHARTIRHADINDIQNLQHLNHDMKLTLQDIADMYSISKHAVWTRFRAGDIVVRHHFQSRPQLQVEGWLLDAGVDFISNDRSILGGKELDIFVPSHNVACEVNGVYWHSELHGKDRQYHLLKTTQCSERGINLLQFNDVEILRTPDIVKSIILHKLGMSGTTIYARKCEVSAISSQESHDFCTKHHIQGGVYGSINFGLKYNNDLVAVLVGGKSRFEQHQYELYRFCTNGASVVGAFGRLFSQWLRVSDYDIVTYSDNRFGTGAVYALAGFEQAGNTPPGYAYFHTSNPHTLLSRFKFQKHKQPALLAVYDSDKSEWDNMQCNGYDRIWDCGNRKWVYKRLPTITN